MRKEKKNVVCYAYHAKAPRNHLALVWAELERAHRYKNTLVEIERTRRNARDSIVNRGDYSWWAVAWKLGLDEWARAEAAEARRRRGCSWGTGGLIEESARQAGCLAQGGSGVGDLPQFAPWDRVGRVGVQIQGGMSIAELQGGQDTQARLLGAGKWRQLWLRLGSTGGRKSIWAVWPVVLHREFPPGARIKWVRVHVTRVADRDQWSAQFVLDVPAPLAPPAPRNGGTVAVDVGWRLFGEEIRVASWVDDAGKSGELRLPAGILSHWHKTQDLQSIRAKNFNRARATLCARRSELPPALQEETTHAYAWKASRRLTGLVRRWSEARAPGDEALFEELEAWAQQERHLWMWEAFGRRNILRQRREIYRLFGRWLADTYATVVVEHLDMREFAEHPGEDEEEESPATKGGRPQRFTVALSILRTTAERMVRAAGGEWVKAPAAWTTQRCADCQRRERFDAAKEVVHTCSHCGRTWDQDLNAARNLLRAARSCAEAAPRSQTETAVAASKTAAQLRRERGLATRRARCSKTGVEPPAETT